MDTIEASQVYCPSLQVSNFYTVVWMLFFCSADGYPVKQLGDLVAEAVLSGAEQKQRRGRVRRRRPDSVQRRPNGLGLVLLHRHDELRRPVASFGDEMAGVDHGDNHRRRRWAAPIGIDARGRGREGNEVAKDQGLTVVALKR